MAFATKIILKPKNGYQAIQNGFRSFSTNKTRNVKIDLSNSFQTYNFESPSTSSITNRDELLKFYRDMSVMRRVEIVADNLYKSKLIRGFLHLYNGQEAIVVGVEASILRDDHVITAYRDHSHYLGRGGTLKEIMSELLGKAGGCSHGKGGSMHMYRVEGNFYGGNGIVGAQTPIGAGIAFAQKYLNTGKVCLTYYGDGAANQGQLFEAYNMASLWKVPCIFVCENNKYGMGTSIERSSADTQYYKRAGFIPGIKIDAMNVFAVKEAVKAAAKWSREGNGPILLEMETYRYMGHSMSDPGLSYRTRDEVNAIRNERDPILKVKNIILKSETATEDELKEIDNQVKQEVDDATEFAKNAPFPEPNALYTDIYTDKPYYVRAVELSNSTIVS